MEVPALAAVSRRNVPPESSVRSFMLESPNPLPKLDGDAEKSLFMPTPLSLISNSIRSFRFLRAT